MERKPRKSSPSVFGGATFKSCSLMTLFAGDSTLRGCGSCSDSPWPPGPVQAQQPLPIFDAHIHYSHDAWDVVPVQDAIAIMRKAGVKRALISSSGDDGQQRLFAAAPDLVIPELRAVPLARRDRHLGARRDADPVPGGAAYEDTICRDRRVPPLRRRRRPAGAAPHGRACAKKHNLFLHAHSDVDAVERLFRQWPQARILWAHAGFERPERVAEMLRKHKNLWADLAFRTDHASGGKVPPWRAVFLQFPDRFMVGTDTFTPERWHYIPEHADWSRRWLADLPREVAERIAWKNGEAVFGSLCTTALVCKTAGPASRRSRARASSRRAPCWLQIGADLGLGSISRSRSRSARSPAPRRSALKVDAHMPEHRHGMNYAPEVKPLGPGAGAPRGSCSTCPGSGSSCSRSRAPARRTALRTAFVCPNSPEEDAKDPGARPVAARGARRPEQPRLGEARGDRLRREALLRAAALGHRLGAVRHLPRSVPRLPGRPAARLRPAGRSTATRRA